VYDFIPPDPRSISSIYEKLMVEVIVPEAANVWIISHTVYELVMRCTTL
jgi:hypothetical protein